MNVPVIVALLLASGEPETDAERNRRNFEESQRKTAKEAMDEWLRLAPQQKWNCAPSAFAARVKALIDEPNLLSQSDYPWCMYASALFLLLRRIPAEVAEYAQKLYAGETAKLGIFEAKVDDALRNFDVVKYGARELEKKPPNNKRLGIDLVDWILLAGLCSGTVFEKNTFSADDYFDGSAESAAEKAEATATLTTILNKSMGYKKVSEIEISSSMTEAQLLAHAPNWQTDVVLVAPLDDYFLGGGMIGTGINPLPLGGNRHAAPVISMDSARVTFWSWGKDAVVKSRKLQSPNVTIDESTGYCSKSLELPKLKSTFFNKRYVIKAELDV